MGGVPPMLDWVPEYQGSHYAAGPEVRQDGVRALLDHSMHRVHTKQAYGGMQLVQSGVHCTTCSIVKLLTSPRPSA